MDRDRSERRDFGCEHCWPATPDAAWEARRALACEAELIDESHFHVMILTCASCDQRFISIFTETIDWADSEDPQYWTLLPITDPEAADLVVRRGSTTEAELNALGPERRCLRHDHPKDTAALSFWGTGIHIGAYD